MYDLINQSREANGVNPVSINMQAVAAATAKAQDMITNNYFNDISPTTGLPSQLLTDYGVTYQTMGENIADVANVTVANNDFLSDPAHRAIMLDPVFNEVGVGVISDDGSEMIVEEFIQT